MTEETKREQPYALYFFLLSFLIIVLSLWVLWFEGVSLRPWKKYQAQYNELKRTMLEDKYQAALKRFNSPEIQQRYSELTSKLKEVEKPFQSPGVQGEYRKVEKELSTIREQLEENKKAFRGARGKYLEYEYLFNKFNKNKDKSQLAVLAKEIEEISDAKQELVKQEGVLKKKLSSFTVTIEKYTAEIDQMKAEVKEAREKMEGMDAVPVNIKQVYMEDINKADRCQSCHIGIDNPYSLSMEHPFTRHPNHFIYLKNHPPSEFGCTFCHRGQGRATSSPEKAHGWVEFWTEPMLKGDMTQATCLTCHGDVKNLKGADFIQWGTDLVEKYGCYGCHKIAGFTHLREPGVELTEVGSKANYTWMVNWLQDPKNYIESVRMPSYNFSKEDAEAIADYLFSMTRETRIDYGSGEIDEDLADKGKAVWRQSRCNICHPTEGVGGAFAKIYAPDLGKVGSKMNRQWLYRWIKEPHIYFPQAKMPRFRFPDEKIRALVEYLMSEYIDWDFEPQYIEPVLITVRSIKKGKELVQTYGCFGCHNVKGMEELKTIGPFLRRGEVTYLRVGEVDLKIGQELSSIGSKPLDRFDFGKVEKEIPHDRISYLTHKLKDPRSFRDGLKMPDYSLPDEEIEALTTTLLGFTDMDMPTRFKVPKVESDYVPAGDFAKIENEVKCLNCHTIKGVGTDFAPDLSIEGSKVQEKWLRAYLKQPDILRPLLKQMPQFNLYLDHKQTMIQQNLTYDEIETIVRYIKVALLTNEIPDTIPENGLSLKEQIKEGKRIYKEKGCRACHQIGLAGGAVGPELTNTGNRLTEGYVFTHLADPRQYIPDIVEPNYEFTEGERINLTRYLMTLKES